MKSRTPPSVSSEIPQWLNNHEFQRFVTLTTNRPDWAVTGSPEANVQHLRRLLRDWDARINRRVVGPKWRKRREDRIWGFYFPEKLRTNPHWHGLIQFFPPYPDQLEGQMLRFDEWAVGCWLQIVPGGSADIQEIEDQSGIAEYVSKELGDAVSFEHFVVPDEF